MLPVCVFSRPSVPVRGRRAAPSAGVAVAALMAGALLAGAALSPAPARAQDNRALIADMQVRITQLEDLVRSLTGSLEEAQFRNRQLEQRLDLIERELDMRLGALEGNGGAGGGGGAGTAMSGGAGAPPATTGGTGQGLAPDTGVLGYLTTPTPGTGTGSGSGGAPASPSLDGAAARALLPAGPPETQYNHAFSLLQQRDYGRAEQAFQAFIDVNAGHSLAGNAQYWLGETYYARGNYEAAAVAFAKGFKDYPNSSKTPDNLFKLGMSMSALGKKREACAAFQKLRADYPTVAGTLQRQVADQMAKNGC